MIDSSEISVIVQGPIYQDITKRCIQSIRKILPKAEIIVSTWQGSNTDGLDYDMLLLNNDPGATPLILHTNFTNNINRQIISTLNGLKKANRKYCLKYRSDLEIKNDKFLSFFGKFQARSPKWRILKERVIMNYATHPHYRALHPTDITCFGLREDVLNIWDIPLSDDENSCYYATNPYPKIFYSPKTVDLVPRIGAEQYMWTSFLKKHEGIYGKFDMRDNWDSRKENILLTEITIANNLLILEREDFDFNSLIHKYLLDEVGRKTWMDSNLWYFYYQKHCCLNQVRWHDFKFHIYYPVKLLLYRIQNCPPVRKFVKSLLPFGFIRPRKLIKLYRNIA